MRGLDFEPDIFLVIVSVVILLAMQLLHENTNFALTLVNKFEPRWQAYLFKLCKWTWTCSTTRDEPHFFCYCTVQGTNMSTKNGNKKGKLLPKKWSLQMKVAKKSTQELYWYISTEFFFNQKRINYVSTHHVLLLNLNLYSHVDLDFGNDNWLSEKF